MRKIPKTTRRKRQKAFKAPIVSFLDGNATRQPSVFNNTYDYILDTKHGELLVGIHYVGQNDDSEVLSVYTRFKDVDRAKQQLDCNPYSGKWNFHIPVKYHTPEEVAENILKCLRNQTE